MAVTTLAAIVTRFRAVLEAAPFSFTAATDQFSHDRQPNAVLDSAYYVEDTGLSDTVSLTNNQQARLDRLTVFVARKLKFDPVTELDTLQDTLLDIERYIKADGPNNSYHVDVVDREVTRPEELDIAIGSVTLEVDYDVSEATS